MRERCLQYGFGNFATHELLEMLLYYSIPRSDTNGVAHSLLERFGSLKGVCEASVDELLLVDGVGQQSAILLRLIPELMKRYAMEDVSPREVYDSVGKLADYFVRAFIGLDHECLFMMLLNNRMNMIDCALISEGSVNSSTVPIRLMTQKSLFKKASSVVLAHNHPAGLALPSGRDIEVTETLLGAFDAIRALPDGNLHRAQLIRGVLGGVHEKRRDAAGAEVLLNAPEHNGEVRVDDVRQNDRNNGASALPDAARLKIGNIVQFLRHPTDQRLGCGGDVRLVPQGVGYRVDRKAGRVGNILQSCFHMHPPDLYCLYYTIFRRKKQEFFSDP